MNTHKMPIVIVAGAGATVAALGAIACQPRADAQQIALTTTPKVAVINVANVTGEVDKSGTKPANPKVLTGQVAVESDWRDDKPGLRYHITAADLPKPFATPGVDNGPHLVRQPEGAWPKAPDGFVVTRFAEGLQNPRIIRTAPNGDLFIAESGPGRIRVLRPGSDGKMVQNVVFAAGLRQPFGIAFYPTGANPQYVYVANTDSVVRFPYQNGDMKTRGAEELIVSSVPGGGRLRGGGHWSRDIVLTPDNKHIFVSVGSRTNVNQENDPNEVHRACIYEFNLDRNGRQTGEGRIYASGIRNPVGIALQPGTDTLWTSVNERDMIGDNLVPDYITSVQEDGYYGWPWYYIGNNPDPRKASERPDLAGKAIVPDVLLQSHYASLALTFYDGNLFPRDYRGDIFAAQHGSWNRSRRNGYKVVRVPVDRRSHKATGEFEDFLTGFVTPEGNVWGRPVGVAVAKDGALMVTDDGSNSVWRIAPGTTR